MTQFAAFVFILTNLLFYDFDGWFRREKCAINFASLMIWHKLTKHLNDSTLSNISQL